MISYGKEKKQKRKGEKGVYIEPTEKSKSQRAALALRKKRLWLPIVKNTF